MARYNDNSIYPEQWTNAKLLREARKYANLETFSSGYYDGPDVTFTRGWANQNGSADVADFCREQTRLYRQEMNNILDEITRRFVKVRRP